MEHTAKEFITKNGVSVLLIDVRGVKSYELAITLRSGYRFAMEEGVEKYEVPHILEHLVFDGSESYPTSDDLLEVFTRSGGDNNGFTTPYNNIYAFHVRASHLYETLKAALDMVYRPRLELASLDEEREVIRNEHMESMNDFSLNASLKTLGQIAPEAALATDQQLSIIDEPILEDVKNFHKKFYTRANTQIILLADFAVESQAKLLSWIDKQMADVPLGKKYDYTPKQVIKPSGILLPEQIGKSIAESTLSLNFITEGKATLRQRIALQLFTRMASGMKSYSLNYILRKKGLVYGIDCGYFITAEVYGVELNLTAGNDRIASILAYSLEGLLDLARNGISDKDFQRIKEDSIGALEDATSSQDSIMTWYFDDYLVESELQTPEDYAQIITSISQREVLELAQSILVFNNLYGTVFTSKKYRMITALQTITQAILKDDVQVDDNLIKSANRYLGPTIKRRFILSTGAALLLLSLYLSFT